MFILQVTYTCELGKSFQPDPDDKHNLRASQTIHCQWNKAYNNTSVVSNLIYFIPVLPQFLSPPFRSGLA